MRVFQLYTLYPAYKKQLPKIRRGLSGYAALSDWLLAHRVGSAHLLLPCLKRTAEAFAAAADDDQAQRAWAQENGLATTDPVEIVLAQIEEHRTEVFYSLDPVRYDNGFLKRLPGCVRQTVAWRAAPSRGAQFDEYDLLLSGLEVIHREYRNRGMRTAQFAPAHDPVMDNYAANTDRPIDLAFVGGYTRHHRRRARVLEAVAVLSDRFNVALHLDQAGMTALAESPLGLVGPLRKYRRPKAIREVSEPPVFGTDMYAVFGRAKIVLNGTIDMAGNDRANMRCWETLGCGALMLGEPGRYPDGMVEGVNFATYPSSDELSRIIPELIEQEAMRTRLAKAGHEMVRSRYSKQRQWDEFQQAL